jgi:cell fate regulator YaaT (PSP1 superfamily)
MSCSTCSTDKTGIPKGCKSNGTCATGGCEKLSVYDWLGNMALPCGEKKFQIVEVRFKNGRKDFFKNEKDLSLCMGDVIAVAAKSGHDIGVVSLTGELVKIQMKKKKVSQDKPDIYTIYRKASQRDIEIWQQAREKEPEVQRKSRLIISRLGLKMKLSDVEFQGDGKKATFYYTADERVDFRLLIRELASTFNIRIEMKQVGLRQEAARLGGIGSCGRELCCSTWLTDFRSVKTDAARYQQLSLNPLKLSGQCGKLKCCLNYELDSYLDALKQFPNTKTYLKTKKGIAVYQKMDIFSGLMWYTYKDNPMHWHKLTVDQVNEIIALNKEGKFPESIEEYADELIIEAPTTDIYKDVVGQDSLTRFDKPKRHKRRNNNRNKNKRRKPNANVKATDTNTKNKQQSNTKNTTKNVSNTTNNSDKSKPKRNNNRNRNNNRRRKPNNNQQKND